MIYLLTAIGLSPGGYTFTHKQYIEQQKNGTSAVASVSFSCISRAK